MTGGLKHSKRCEVKVRLDVLEEIDFLAERYALFPRAS